MSLQYVSQWTDMPALPLLESDPAAKHSLIFIPGLTDSVATVPYVHALATAISRLGFSLVQPQLSSSLGGFGLSSLESDAQEICLVIDRLRQRKDSPKPKGGKIVLMGHSTGCQDIAHLLSKARQGLAVDGAILQAPVSDREHFEFHDGATEEGKERLRVATEMVRQGKGGMLLDRQVRLDHTKEDECKVNASAFQDPAMTAYRCWSLFAKGGDDDYFSSDLDDEVTTKIWSDVIARGNRVLAILGQMDETYPPHVSPEELSSRWLALTRSMVELDPARSFEAVVLPKANHRVDNVEARTQMLLLISNLLQMVLADERSSVNDPLDQTSHIPHASFDEVVELISSGKADSIPGVKTIPLKVGQGERRTAKLCWLSHRMMPSPFP